MPETVPALRVSHLSKRYGAHLALADFSADFGVGSVTALLGENGSGKSTLIKALAGLHPMEPGGGIEVGGEALRTPITANAVHAAGLRFVHQDLGLIDELTVTDNLAFTHGFVTNGVGLLARRAAERRAAALFTTLNIDIDPSARVADLSPAQRTMFAIARAMDGLVVDGAVTSRAIIFLDEPTAALSSREAEQVFQAVNALRSAGGTVILVTHRTDEVVALADRILVLRGGRLVEQREARGLSAPQIVELILGRALNVPVDLPRSDRPHDADAVLELVHVSGRMTDGVSVTVHAGEVVGIAGLTGCGRSELARFAAGAQRPRAGAMRLAGTPYAPSGPRAALKSAVASVPQNRHRDGIVGDLPLQANVTLADLRSVSAGPSLSRRKELAAVTEQIRRLNIQPPTPSRAIRLFSGGNQQKGVLARAIRTNPRLLVLDEPTQGVDAGARHEIAGVIRRLAQRGAGVLLGSSDVAELVEVADRVIVLDRGRVVGELRGADLTVQAITALSSGATDHSTTEEHA